MNDRAEKTLVPSQWLVKVEGDNKGKIFGWNPILARRADMAPYDGPIDERGFAVGYAVTPEIAEVCEQKNLVEDPAMEASEENNIDTARPSIPVLLPKARAIPPVTEMLDQKIFRLREEENSLSKIAEIVGKSKTAVFKRLKKMKGE